MNESALTSIMARSWGSDLLGETDHRIVEMLVRDGRIPSNLIGTEVSLKDASITARLKNLFERGYIAVVPQFDWRAVGFVAEAFVFINVVGYNPYDLARELAQRPEVYVSCAILGDADVLLILLCQNEESLYEVITDIRNHTGVADLRINRIVDCAFWRLFAAKLPYKPSDPLDFPNPVVALDDNDRRIIACLQEDGRASSRKISRVVGIGDARVRARIKRMEDAGLLRISAIVDPIALGVTIAYLDIDTFGDPAEVLNRLSKNPNFFFCATCIGQGSLMATIGYPDDNLLQEAVFKTIWRIDGVKHVRLYRLGMIAKYKPDLVRIK